MILTLSLASLEASKMYDHLFFFIKYMNWKSHMKHKENEIQSLHYFYVGNLSDIGVTTALESMSVPSPSTEYQLILVKL